MVVACASMPIKENSKIKESCIYQSNNEGLLLWNDSCLLSWDNYKITKVDTNSIYKAETFTKVKVKNLGFNEDSIFFHIGTFFNEKKSYKTVGFMNRDLLVHEQLHFDISEIAARKIRKAYSKYVSTDGSLYITSKYIKSTFNKFIAEADSLDYLYDKESNHGINYKEQARWNEKISKILKDYKDYSNPKVVMKRKLSKEYLDLGKDKSKD